MRKQMEMMLALVLLFVGSQLGRASTITLISSSAGVYDYGMTINVGETVSLDFGDTITLSDLSGVTGASVILSPGSLPFTVGALTSNSVVFDAVAGATFDNASIAPITVGTLVVDSSVLTTGTVDFAMETANEGTVAGSTTGPTAVPEPSVLILLGTAMMGLVAFRHRFAKK